MKPTISIRPKISIVVTTHNRPVMLQRAVDSILDQTFQDFEIIIIDDCSSKPLSLNIPKKDENRIAIVRMPWNTGFHTRPKNVGVMCSKAKVIAYLDDDNRFLPNHLEVLYKVLVEKNADVVYGDRTYKSTIPNEKRFMGEMSKGFDAELLEKGNYVDTSDIMHTTKALIDVGYWDIRWERKPDWLLMLAFSRAGKNIIHVPKVITEYNWHDSNLSATPIKSQKRFIDDL